MTERKTWHVTPRSDGWQVKREGAERAASRHGTKDEAVDAARQVARNNAPSQLVVHRTDGTIQQESTYEPGTAA